MHPNRHAQLEFEQQCPTQHQETENEDGKNRRTVAGIGKGIAEPARATALGQTKAAGKQGTVAASRTTTFEAGEPRGGRLGHCRTSLACGRSILRPCRTSNGRRGRVSPPCPRQVRDRLSAPVACLPPIRKCTGTGTA